MVTVEGDVYPRANNGKFRQYLAATTATLSALCMGVCLSWTSPALPMLQRPMSRIPVSPEQGSWIGSLLTLGAFVGAIPAGRTVSIAGPKRTLQLLAFPLFASWIIIAYCGTIYGLYVARFLAGIACGAICVAAPSYVAEIADPAVRGTLGTLFQLQITCGFLLGYVLGGLLDDFILLALIPGVIPVVYLTCLVFMPESPVYLCSRGDVDLAAMSLRWFGRDAATNGATDSLVGGGGRTHRNAEIARIMEEIRCADLAGGGGGLRSLLASIAGFRALLVSMGLMLFQQCSGINAVLFYTGGIFAESGSTLPPDVCAIIIGFVQVVATYASTLLVDRAGRRVLLILSSSVMSLCLISLGVYFHAFHATPGYGYVPVTALAVFIVVFSIGYGPIPWIMLGELFNPRLKGTAMSISASFNWLVAFAVTKLYHNFLDAFGASLTFSAFGAVCMLATVFSVLCVPETKGKRLEEISAELCGMRADAECSEDIEVKKITV